VRVRVSCSFPGRASLPSGACGRPPIVSCTPPQPEGSMVATAEGSPRLAGRTRVEGGSLGQPGKALVPG